VVSVKPRKDRIGPQSRTGEEVNIPPGKARALKNRQRNPGIDEQEKKSPQ